VTTPIGLADKSATLCSTTLIVAGELRLICGPAQARPIASAITGAQLVMLSACGHIPSVEAPQQGTVTRCWNSSETDHYTNLVAPQGHLCRSRVYLANGVSGVFG
jgi:hypothetical protein